jgi:hypothetical protein
MEDQCLELINKITVLVRDSVKKKFNRLEKYLNEYRPAPTPQGKATAEEEASKNPMKALKNKKYLDIRRLKGVAV